LLKYWEFKPFEDQNENTSERPRRQNSDGGSSDKTRVESAPESNGAGAKRRWGFRFFKKGKVTNESKTSPRTPISEGDKEKVKVFKKMPVLFFDEAHKLYVHLIFSFRLANESLALYLRLI
jgi:hypothetical protein